jgi:Glycosyl transferase family 11
MTTNPNTVTVMMQGGLGNQLFQYAAAFALAKRTGAELLMDVDEFRNVGPRRYYLACYGITGPFTEPLPPVAFVTAKAVAKARSLWERVARRLLWNRVALRLWPEPVALSEPQPRIYRQSVYHFDEAFPNLTPPIKLIGYFQNELYFTDFASEIRDIFSIRIPTTPAFDAQSRRIRAAAWPVSVHVRRGDYVSVNTTLAYHGICEEAYYRRAMSIMPSQCGAAPTYFIFSDDLAASRAMFGDAPDVVYVEGDIDRPWEDLALMAECRAHIIANSSLSWWGAWLNGKPDKCVIAPRHWFTRRRLRENSTADLYGDGWIII